MTVTSGNTPEERAIAASVVRAGLNNLRESLTAYKEIYDELVKGGYEPQTAKQRDQWNDVERAVSNITATTVAWYGVVLDAMTARLENGPPAAIAAGGAPTAQGEESQ